MYVATVDWFFCSHFLDRAIAARHAGFDVLLAAHLEGSVRQLELDAIRALPWDVSRKNVVPWSEASSLLQLVRHYKRERPDIVHHIAIKPIVYGTFAALVTRVPHIVNAPVGMGFAFASTGSMARVLKPVVKLLLKLTLAPRSTKVVFENADDLSNAVRHRFLPLSSAVLIRGAGIDLERFRPTPEPAGRVRIVLVGRMLREKGVREFVGAARQLRCEGIQAEWVLIGGPDAHNLGSLNQSTLDRWNAEGVVTWLGERRDVDLLLAASHIVALPSYREGLPKSLLEAMAAGKPIITTDVPGCREVCLNEVNGLLVPARDIGALAAAMRDLIQNPQKRIRFGLEGRRLAERCFSTQLVQEQTLALYRDLLRENSAE